MPTGEKREGREGQYEDNEEGKRKKRSCTDEVPRGARTWVEVWIVVLALDARVGAAAQEVLVDLQIALEVRKVSRAVQRREALLVPLVHLPAVVQDMMKHVKLLVGRRKVHGGAGAIVLGPEVRVALHDLRQLLRVPEADARIKREGRVLRGRRVAPRAGHIAGHLVVCLFVKARPREGPSVVQSVVRSLGRRGRRSSRGARGLPDESVPPP